ncbi:hypothetical protein GSB9_02525 [Flavobacteriaceae bacterium GSB9]|nr:hypothetical protein GSB9_02525 [Flavobacteriaceae bacterium GSB9]
MLFSCEYFNVKKTSSEAILNEELQTFNWNDVDEYPSFQACESSISKTERKVCFQYTLTNHIANFLKKEVVVVGQDVQDTVMLQFQVSKRGDLVLIQVEADSITEYEIPEIKTLLEKSLDSLPEIFPALKRGQQVTTEFKLPIIISVN